MQMDKNRQYRTINENNRVTDTFFTLLFANPQHFVQHYIESRTLGPTLVKAR